MKHYHALGVYILLVVSFSHFMDSENLMPSFSLLSDTEAMILD